ncbi:hypothetical protein [Arthrobacter caoxuetaonis]|uniref:Phospholipase_D-nuclease N-terminal n=1 Tax=Arthrobacter caoxuetaonis TaxID=2886935 RepID=A0A9X1MDG7_9MICC|nr:hypothetical protein [Arthrobacter caoxuetaonis]MCC3298038.1 hypothetical protein [Arthrobacter caoxuetaonis]USQ57051.1 hypothetical protein NF551_15160 [Arthrobacter caoxuetaonis]
MGAPPSFDTDRKRPGTAMPVEVLMWIPAAALLLLLIVTLTIGALISLWHTDGVTGPRRAFWCTGILLFPVAGALVWLAALHRSSSGGVPEAAGSQELRPREPTESG